MKLNANSFPNNKKYVPGECYLTWSRTNSLIGGFVIENCEIDDSLIIEAKPSSNILILIDGNEINKIAFTVRPCLNGKKKEYGIASSTNDNGITISIIDFSQNQIEEPIDDKSPFADEPKRKTKLKRVEV